MCTFSFLIQCYFGGYLKSGAEHLSAMKHRHGHKTWIRCRYRTQQNPKSKIWVHDKQCLLLLLHIDKFINKMYVLTYKLL